MDQLLGAVERITFQSEETGYTIAKLQVKGQKEYTCIIGHLPGLTPGETIRCFGKWIRHPVHGLQFEVEKHRIERPADLAGIHKYLGSGLIKGIGPTYAKKIVETFGIKTLEVIDNTPERLFDVPGIGKKRAQDIAACWQEQRSIRDVMLFLQAHDVSPVWAQKIYKIYGNQAIEKVSENPYLLARDIRGIGFLAADKIAKTMGIVGDKPERIDAAIEYTLTQLEGGGHTCYPVQEFLPKVEEIVSLQVDLIEKRLSSLQKEERIIVETQIYQQKQLPFIWSAPLYRSEVGIAGDLARLEKGNTRLREIQTDKAIEWVEKKLKMTLAENQAKAVSYALSEKILIITGGPGTGKSTITKAILAITEQLSKEILLAAPTGRAAKRMSEITGREAKTLHSLLEVGFGGSGFKRNRENPLDCDLLIIDEASMIDTLLMYQVLKAIPSHARLIIIGDIYQLPSVGPGNVLRELITSKTIPTVMLSEIFRQAEGSHIITNAHKINAGSMPDLNQKGESDFYFIEAKEGEEVKNAIIALVADRIPKKFHFDPIDDIQVLSPMRRGIMGIENLNTELQAILNPRPKELSRYGRSFRVGDKVMQLRNNYKKEVFNGDVGRIAEIDEQALEVTLNFEGKNVVYAFSDLDELQLAYAVSIHKYQGSEARCVVIPVDTAHFMMLQRNLLYTAVTRGKELVILVGSRKAIALAVNNQEVQKRFSGLLTALREKGLDKKHSPV